MSTEIRSRLILNSVASLISVPRCSSGLQLNLVSISVTLDVLRNTVAKSICSCLRIWKFPSEGNWTTRGTGQTRVDEMNRQVVHECTLEVLLKPLWLHLKQKSLTVLLPTILLHSLRDTIAKKLFVITSVNAPTKRFSVPPNNCWMVMLDALVPVNATILSSQTKLFENVSL